MRAGFFSAAVTALSVALSLSGGRPALAGPALVFDPADGTVLYAEDADDHWHPASLTKIMTAYLTFEALRNKTLTLEQRIPYSERAQSQPPSKLGLNLTATLTVDQALKALIIKSANDVAIMLAEAIGGTQPEFVARMNRTAERLGMTRTTFVNPNGLPAFEQVTTARDLAKLTRAVVKDYPEYGAYWSMFDAQIGKIRIGTHNGLLRTFDGADGMKTGFICDSGFNVVASATRDGRRIMAVVLGEASSKQRTVRAANLLEHGFESYGWKELFKHSDSLDTMPIAADAKGVTSVRTAVRSFECGTGVRSKKPAKARPKKPQSVHATEPKAADGVGDAKVGAASSPAPSAD